MIKWIRLLFGRNGPRPEETAGEITKRNVGHHQRRIVLEMRRLDRELDAALSKSEEAPAD